MWKATWLSIVKYLFNYQRYNCSTFLGCGFHLRYFLFTHTNKPILSLLPSFPRYGTIKVLNISDNDPSTNGTSIRILSNKQPCTILFTPSNPYRGINAVIYNVTSKHTFFSNFLTNSGIIGRFRGGLAPSLMYKLSFSFAHLFKQPKHPPTSHEHQYFLHTQLFIHGPPNNSTDMPLVCFHTLYKSRLP